TAAATVGVSENPVRSDQVVISWPLGATAARVGIYTFTGARLISATVAPPTNEFVWDLTAGGRRVVSGAYLVVVQVDGRGARHRVARDRSGARAGRAARRGVERRRGAARRRDGRGARAAVAVAHARGGNRDGRRHRLNSPRGGPSIRAVFFENHSHSS